MTSRNTSQLVVASTVAEKVAENWGVSLVVRFFSSPVCVRAPELMQLGETGGRLLAAV